MIPIPTTAHKPRVLTLSLLGVAGALAVSLSAPLATTVIGLALFGILHHVLELRYITGRFGTLFSLEGWVLLLVLISGIVVCRIMSAWAPGLTGFCEISLGYLVIGYALVRVLRGRRRVIALTLVAALAGVSFWWSTWHFVVLTHLHNVIPLFFWWEWSRRITDPLRRRAFRAIHLLWVVAIPTLILTGALDGILTTTGSQIVAPLVGDGASIVRSTSIPGASPVVDLRFLTVFAFGQTMHYVTWVGMMPALTSHETQTFEERVPALRGWRTWALGLGLASLLGLVFASDYLQGRSLYATIASYHAYLEYPVLLGVVFGSARYLGGDGERDPVESSATAKADHLTPDRKDPVRCSPPLPMC